MDVSERAGRLGDSSEERFELIFGHVSDYKPPVELTLELDQPPPDRYGQCPHVVVEIMHLVKLFARQMDRILLDYLKKMCKARYSVQLGRLGEPPPLAVFQLLNIVLG